MRATLAALLLAGAPALARDIEINQTCLPGFCVESRIAFSVIARQPEKGQYRLRVFEPGAVLYVQTGDAPFEHPCEPHCSRERLPGEERLVQRATGRLLARRTGPYAPCGEGAPFFVTLYQYLPGIDLDSFRVARHCQAVTPPRSRLSPHG